MKKLHLFFEKYQIEIILLLFCLPALAGIRTIGIYANPYYLIDYSTGFGGRKFIGELCSLWLPEFGIRKRHLLPLLFTVHLTAIIVFTHLAGSSLRKAKGATCYWIQIGLLAIYLLFPYSFKGLIQYMNGYLDIFLVDYSLLFCWLFIKKRDTTFYYIATVVLLLAAGLTHHIFCCVFFPLFLSLFIYDIYSEGFSKKKFLIYGSLTTLLLGLFCFIVFFSKMNIGIETLIEQLKRRTTLDIQDDVIYYEYYAKLSEHIPEFILPNWKSNLARLLLTPIFLYPIFFFFEFPLIIAARKSKKRNRKLMYALMLLSQLLFIPAFIMAIDYGRWYYALFFCLFMQLWVLFSIGDEEYLLAIKHLWTWLKKHPLILVVFILTIIDLIRTSLVSSNVSLIPPIENIIGKLNLY